MNGHDMDIAYYQVGTPNNVLRSVCEHREPNGEDAYHCTDEPVYLDAWRTAVFLAYLHDNPHLRVIGVDGQVGPRSHLAIHSDHPQVGIVVEVGEKDGGTPSIQVNGFIGAMIGILTVWLTVLAHAAQNIVGCAHLVIGDVHIVPIHMGPLRRGPM